jgi:hypothetical protein
VADVVVTDRDDDANVSTMGMRPDQFVDWSDGEDVALPMDDAAEAGCCCCCSREEEGMIFSSTSRLDDYGT